MGTRRIREILAVVGLLALPLLLLRGAIAEGGATNSLDRAVRRLGAPVRAAVSYGTGMLGAFFERWVLQARMQDANGELRKENRELKLRLRTVELLEEENRELRRALQMRELASEDLLAAERVGVDQSPFFRVISIRIDRGGRFVRPGMAVVAADGVVGRLGTVEDEWSDVLLITDPRSRLAVEVARNHAQGILRGLGEDACTVRISKDFDVREGDLVQTSGVDELFPKGHAVGRVVAVEDLVGDEREVRVVPMVRFDRLDVMWVVLARPPEADPWASHPTGPVQARGLQPVR
jgi:rod shape-determining protein MreC